MALQDYLEIISKEQWKKGEPYRREFQQTFSKEQYKQVAPKLFELFRKMNNGKLQKTLIFDFKIKEPQMLNRHDMVLMDALLELGYTVDKISYQSGFAMKNNKQVKIHDILASMESKIKTKDKMKEQYEKTKNEIIKMQIDFIDKLDDYELIMTNNKINFPKLSIFNDKDRKIVITYDHRAIASQSTEVGWRSCMNLVNGVYKEYVGSGTSAGMFIAYLVEKGDEYELKNPIGRVLFKPYNDNKNQTVWVADKLYPNEAPAAFRKQVQALIDEYQDISGEFRIAGGVYRDELNARITYTTKNIRDAIQKFKNDNASIKDMDEEAQEYILRYYEANAIKNIQNPSEKLQLAAVQSDGLTIQFIQNPSEKAQLAAVGDHYAAIQFIKNPSEKVKSAAIENRADAIQYIENPSEKLQIQAVTSEANVLEYIKNPSEKVQLTAVKNHGPALQFLKNPSDAVKMAALENTAWVIEYIKNPTEEMQIYALQTSGALIEFIENPSEKVQLVAMTRRPSAFPYIKNPTPKVKELAVKGYGENIQYIKNQSPKLQLLAVQQDGSVLRYCKNPSDAVKIAAIETYPLAIRYIKNPTRAMQMKAVEGDSDALYYLKEVADEEVIKFSINHDWRTIRFVLKPSEAAQLQAISYDADAIKYIADPTDNAIKAALKKDGHMIEHVRKEKRTLEIQLLAVNTTPWAIQHIDNPSLAVQMAAVKKHPRVIGLIRKPKPSVQVVAVTQDPSSYDTLFDATNGKPTKRAYEIYQKYVEKEEKKKTPGLKDLVIADKKKS